MTPRPTELSQSMQSIRSLSDQLTQTLDPFGISASFLQVQQAWLKHPQQWSEAVNALAHDMTALQVHLVKRMMGLPSEDAIPAQPDDNRFAEPEWTENVTWDMVKEVYLLYTHWLMNTVMQTPDISDKEVRKAAFWTRTIANLVAPTNFFWTNPVVQKKAVETQGQSLIDGLKNLMNDLRAGEISMVDRSAFRVGENLGNAPGEVVFRNELIELIHYQHTTPKVRAMPIVMIPAWINKYYILDLNDKKSMVRYLVNQGFDVYMVSWKNPTKDMSNFSIDDYMLKGALQAVDVARKISKSEQVHAVGYCIGGTLLTMLMAWLAREHKTAKTCPIAHWTLFTTLVDFGRPGDIDVFVDEDTLKQIDKMMSQSGFLDSKDIGGAFRMLRSNNLIWYYFVHNYMLGETPAAFDVLYWNVDGTRLTKCSHEFLLRQLYLENKLVQKDALTVAGHKLDLGLIKQPVYAIGAEEDHIAPWQETFKLMNLVGGPAQYALSSSGHILGIVNPPVNPPKRSYRVSDAKGETDTAAWFKKTPKQPGTWWEHWVKWLNENCGEQVAAGALTTKEFPKLADAPGVYVKEA